jgi:hypothetical protein
MASGWGDLNRIANPGKNQERPEFKNASGLFLRKASEAKGAFLHCPRSAGLQPAYDPVSNVELMDSL